MDVGITTQMDVGITTPMDVGVTTRLPINDPGIQEDGRSLKVTARGSVKRGAIMSDIDTPRVLRSHVGSASNTISSATASASIPDKLTQHEGQLQCIAAVRDMV